MPNTHSTLTSLFMDIANAIRAKKGTSADIVADNFPSEIASIPSGGTEITDGIVVKARNSSNQITEIDYYGNIVASYQFYNQNSSTGGYRSLATINWKTTTTVVREYAFYYCRALKSPPPTTTGTFYGWCYASSGITAIDCPHAILNGAAQFNGCSSLTTVNLPSAIDIGNIVFSSCKALTTATFGAIGKPMNTIHSSAFQGCNQEGLSITIFTIGSKVDTLLSSIRNGATNATIIIKASGDTTYNGTSYAAGETMITSEVA